MTSRVEAAIDIGSNTVHLLVASSERSVLRRHFEEANRLQLGKDVAETGAISRRKARVTADTVFAFSQRARRLGAQRVHVLATQAVRSARNRTEVVAEIERRSGMRVTVLDPCVESYLAALGAELGHPSWGETQWVADIGGASTQVALVQSGRLESCTSLSVGSLQLTQCPPRLERGALGMQMAELREVLRSLPPAGGIRQANGADWTIVGGAARRLARFLERTGLPAVIATTEIDAALEVLGSRNAAPAMRDHGLHPGQLSMVWAGATILAQLLREADMSSCTVSPFGIREGAIRYAASSRCLGHAGEFLPAEAGAVWERPLPAA